MRAVIDESVPRALAIRLQQVGCPIETFPNRWKGTSNGRLLTLIEESGFDCLVTCDKSMRWQQPVASRRIALVLLPAQKLVEIEKIVDAIADAIRRAAPGQVFTISKP